VALREGNAGTSTFGFEIGRLFLAPTSKRPPHGLYPELLVQHGWNFFCYDQEMCDKETGQRTGKTVDLEGEFLSAIDFGSAGCRTHLANLTVELAAKSASFKHCLQDGVLISLLRRR
jgi:hypothetical protein